MSEPLTATERVMELQLRAVVYEYVTERRGIQLADADTVDDIQSITDELASYLKELVEFSEEI